MNYFEFYDLPVSFHVDDDALRQQYYRKSRQYHPDFHTLSTVQHQEEMQALSTLNNEAYKTLADPDRRMRYILELYGLLGGEADAATQLPQAFLLEMMELNESLMELEFEFDPARHEQAVLELQNTENQLYTAIEPILYGYPESANPDADLRLVKEYYLKNRYLLRIRENLSKFAAL